MSPLGSTSMITVAGTVALAGTRGYLPPEFADGKRGVKSDVYRYGCKYWDDCYNNYNDLMMYAVLQGVFGDLYRIACLFRIQRGMQAGKRLAVTRRMNFNHCYNYCCYWFVLSTVLHRLTIVKKSWRSGQINKGLNSVLMESQVHPRTMLLMLFLMSLRSALQIAIGRDAIWMRWLLNYLLL